MKGDFRIGEWMVHPHLNSLERNEETIHLEPKVMQVLLTLAAEPGEVVTREQVRSAVWPDVFVGEDVLIRAISELRRAFSDDPRSPHTIQTVPKVGYRLIAPVSPQTVPFTSPAEFPPEPEPSPHVDPISIVASPKRKRSAFWPTILILLLAVVIAVCVAFVLHILHRPALRSETYTTRPLTTYPGSQLQASFSPDGSAIAFVWRKDGEQNGHIYTKLLTSETPVRLTTGQADEISPAWSPDGHFIAFIRHDDQRSRVVIVPSMGGSEQEVYDLPTNSVWEYGGLAWTADGTSLIFPELSTPQSPSTLVELRLKDRSVRPLTAPPAGWDGDWTPAISPDGTRLAFIRGPDRSARDIYFMTLPDGKPQRLTHDSSLIVALTWTVDGSSIVFSSHRGGSLSLWRISANGGTPEHEPAGGDDAYGPSIARHGNRMVYSHGNAIWSILAANLTGKGPATTADILTSSEQDASPHVSPSGNAIAFQSWRSGSQEIWTAGIDGSNPVELTSAGASAGSPAWSPDGRQIAFDAQPNSFAHIYVIDAVGGTPRAVTSGNHNDIVPSWSADGRSLYFGSNRTGSWQIWKGPADGSSPPRQITANGGIVALESADGKSIYFTKFEQAGIWQRSLVGGPERKVFAGPPSENFAYWTLHDGKLYSLSSQGGQFAIQQIDPATGNSQTVYIMKHSPTPFAGLSVTPEGKRIVFAELIQASSNLMLIEHFR